MNRALRTVLGGIAASLVLLAGSTRPAHAIGLTGGDIPVPARVVGGVYQPVWDGSYSDLLAADALAACWTTQTVTAFDPTASNGAELDSFISNLISRMVTASCKTTCSNPAYTSTEDIQICAYLDSRRDATCNMDPATRQARALDTSKLRATTQTQDYQMPTAAMLVMSGTMATRAVQRAQAELSYAELALCMAVQLSQRLDTVQVAFAS